MIRVSASTFGLIAALLIAGTPRAGGSELLANGGFEQGSAGWSLNAGTLDVVASPVHSGALAGLFSGTGQPTTQIVYQLINVQAAKSYELSGWIAASSSSASRIFLRVSWFDANGQLVLSDDSPWLSQPDGAFHPLSTGARLAPAAARQARVSVLVQVDSPFAVHLDDLAVSGPAAVPPPPVTSTPAPPVTPSPPPPTGTPATTPRPVPSATRTPAPQHTPSATVGATPTAVPEPLVFPNLVNGGFEQLRQDGTLYGWRKQGGEMGTVTEQRTDGSRAAALVSETSSTKWVYQTVSVLGGAYYEASVQSFADSGSEAAFLRLSWYASPDGSAQAIDSVDSLELASPSHGAFRLLTTGAVQAPPDAASVKFRLMLRPSSAQPAAAYFDSAAFGQTQPTGEEIVRAADNPIAGAGGRGLSAVAGGGVEVPVAAPATPMSLANVKPLRPDTAQPPAGAGQGRNDWAIVLALGVALAAVSLAGGHELWQRHRRDEGAASED